MPTLYPQLSHQLADLDAISEKGIGEMVCPKMAITITGNPTI